ncbi:hypothetical protein GCM10028807_07830 [Spirosoma daeguense]
MLKLDQAKNLKQKMLAFKRKAATNSAFSTLTYVPVRPHIIRRSDGSGGFALSDMNEVMAMANKYYMMNGLGIQFYFSGETPDYIDNDDVYESFAGPPGPFDAPNAMNQYYVHRIQGGWAGLAQFPANNLYSTQSIIEVSSTPNIKKIIGNYVIPHEFGHNFGLYHTFGMGSGDIPTAELVTRGPGANCETEGDFICDTPADPYGRADASSYTEDANGCFVYSPSNTARDANGEPYSPPMTNIMSYWNGGNCSHDFTAEQYDHIQQALALRQSHTAYTLDAPATSMTPPSNLSLSYTGNSIALNWQDNATNEMGYFIERSTVPNGSFIPIGGVGPNVTTFTDTDVLANRTYYYRIRPSNTITNHLSQTVAFTTCTVPQYPTPNPSRSTANLYWITQVGQTYNVRWHQSGAAEWTIIEGINSVPCTLTGLTASTTYEWEVQSVCSPTASSSYVAGQTFTTYSCTAPYFLGTTGATSSAAELYWYVSPTEPGKTFDIRYRTMGSTDWTTVSGIATQSYSLTGLPTNTTFEWQIKSVCTATESSTFTASATFTTQCRIPTALYGLASQTKARLQWSSPFPSDAQSFQLRYRPVGNLAWVTVNTGIQPNYELIGLSTDVTYEWQVASVCSVSAISDFSILATFTTSCSPPKTQDLSTSIIMSSSAQFNWFATTDPGTLFTLRYRPIGAPNWTTVSSLTATTSNAVYTTGTYSATSLLPGTNYEWEVATACSPTQNSTFTAGPAFTSLCPTPINLYPAVFVTSASLYWDSVSPTATYEARYRQLGTSDWTVITNITSTTITVTGLIANSAYDWEVRTLCGNGTASNYSSTRTFYTPGCTTPINLQTTSLTNTSARLNWTFLAANVDTRYQGRYRVIGASAWIMLDNLTSTDGTGYTILNGLVVGTAYEWQIRTLCSGTESSEFSNSVTFYTSIPCNGMYTIKTGSWVDPTVWSCNRIPVGSDVVQLRHVVNLPASYVATAQKLQFNPGTTLTYGADARLILGF